MWKKSLHSDLLRPQVCQNKLKFYYTNFKISQKARSKFFYMATPYKPKYRMTMLHGRVLLYTSPMFPQTRPAIAWGWFAVARQLCLSREWFSCTKFMVDAGGGGVGGGGVVQINCIITHWKHAEKDNFVDIRVCRILTTTSYKGYVIQYIV